MIYFNFFPYIDISQIFDSTFYPLLWNIFPPVVKIKLLFLKHTYSVFVLVRFQRSGIIGSDKQSKEIHPDIIMVLALVRFPQFSAQKHTEAMFLIPLSSLSTVISKLVTHFLSLFSFYCKSQCYQNEHPILDLE